MAVGNLELIKSETSGSAVSSFDVDNIFSADYDVYMLQLECGNGSTLQNLNLRYRTSGGSTISTSTYDVADLDMQSNATFGENRATNGTQIPRQLVTQTGLGNSATIYIFNPYDSSSYTFTLNQQANFYSGILNGRKQISVEKTAQSYTGINFFPTTGTVDNIKVSVYGVK